MSKTNPEVKIAIEWQNKFNELCWQVFYKYKPGAELLQHMENKFFRSPVAIPGQDISWAYLNEGRNELIRSFTQALQIHMMKADKNATTKTVERSK